MTLWIRMADTAARHREVADLAEARVLEVLRSGRYVGGPVVAEAEAMAASWFGRREAVGVASGTDALMLALQAAGVRAGDEVIVPALSFFATAGAVAAIGAVPVVVDVLEDGTMDPSAAEAAFGRRTRAVVPVHLFGNRATSPVVDAPIVDDAAQAVGGDPPRSTGVLTAISVYPTKTWGAAGDGGFVIGDDTSAVRRLANHGMNGVPHHHERVDGLVGRNSRLDALQAAVLVAQGTRLSERVGRRRALADRYDRGLPSRVRALPRDPGSPVHQYLVLVDRRDDVRAALEARGIETAVYYPRPLNRQPALATSADTPVAEDLCRRLLALPVHEGVTPEDVDRVLEALADVA